MQLETAYKKKTVLKMTNMFLLICGNMQSTKNAVYRNVLDHVKCDDCFQPLRLLTHSGFPSTVAVFI